jgi:STE24 endopeptidase
VNEDKATRYQRLGRHASVLGVVVSTALLAVLAASGASVAMRRSIESICSTLPPRFVPAAVVALYVVLLAVLHEVVTLPFAFYRGHLLERRYGLTAQAAAGWLGDHLKTGLIGLLFALAACELIYAALRDFPVWWWAITAAVLGLVMAVLAKLAPVVLLPMFYRFTPLEREALHDRLVALARRAGATVVRAYEWKLSDRTHKANAALTGLGGTRRILLSDTLLAEYSDDEIEVILAHELAHHVHRDIWTGMVYETALLAAGLYAAHWTLTLLAPKAGLIAPWDVAGLPMLALAAGGISLLLLPLANALSRAHEYRADRFALDVTANPAAFISAMQRLGAQNLAEDAPSRLVEILFHTHPPMSRRIAVARAWTRD